MSVTLPLSGQVEGPVSTALTTTSATVVFTASTKYTQKVVAIWIANEDTSNTIKVTLDWNNGSTDATFFVGDIPAKTTAVVDTPLLLTSREATHTIKATASTANQITVTVITVGDLSQQGRMG